MLFALLFAWSSIFVPVLVVIGLKWVKVGSKKYQKFWFGWFELYLTFWPPGLGQNKIQKFWFPQLYDHTCQTSPYPSWGWSNWPWSTDYLRSLVKYGFFGFFSKNKFLNFLQFQGLKCFLSRSGTNVPSLVQIQRRIPDLQPPRGCLLFYYQEDVL